MGGSCIVNAGKCILIATYNEAKGHNSPDCNETITLIGRYLFKSTWPVGKDVENSQDNSSPTWKSYIDKLIIGKGGVSQAIICKSVDGTLLAATDDFKVYLFSNFMRLTI